MEARLTIQSRPDAIDAERFGEMIRSPLFALFRARLEAELERTRGQCEHADDELELRRAQGGVKALRAALALPEAIRTEMAKKAGAQPGAKRRIRNYGN